MSDPPKTFVEYIEQISPPWLLGTLGKGFVKIVFSEVADRLRDHQSQAIKMPWLKEPTSPDDVLPLVGGERRLPKYPLETLPNWRNRLWTAWDIYKFGGSLQVIPEQLADAGYPGCTIHGPWDTAMTPAGYWSHFIVVIPVGVITGSPAWGAFDWGDGTLWGISGLTLEQLALIRAIVQKWKPVDWICRTLRFMTGPSTYVDVPPLAFWPPPNRPPGWQ